MSSDQQSKTVDRQKPAKGILKPSSSFDKQASSHRKSAKFDEVNVLQTYHPADKDYGYMKIEEPKTPYHLPNEVVDGLDAELLAEKLKGVQDQDSDDEDETEEQRKKRLEFEKRRKAHYNEFDEVRRARKLIQEEDEDEDEPHEGKNCQTSSESDDSVDDERMDVDSTAKQSTSSGGRHR